MKWTGRCVTACDRRIDSADRMDLIRRPIYVDIPHRTLQRTLITSLWFDSDGWEAATIGSSIH
jgi:hypothetical protein